MPSFLEYFSEQDYCQQEINYTKINICNSYYQFFLMYFFQIATSIKDPMLPFPPHPLPLLSLKGNPSNLLSGLLQPVAKIQLLHIMKEGSESSDYQIVIIECCENCETHQSFARHSEWKYFEQFNELKRKIQKFVANTVVIKNPVPDELVKNAEIKNEKNLFVNRDTGEKIIFPRIGSFEIYIYNILISSKLITNQWPNHYKILQLVAKIIEEKKNGNSLHPYSVYNDPQIPQLSSANPQQVAKEGESPDKRTHRIVSKKKKATNQLTSKAYKSIEKGESFRDARSTLQPLTTKLIDLDSSPAPKNRRNLGRYLESKAENRVKLPSLNATMNLREQSRKETIDEKDSRFENKEKSEQFSQISSQIAAIPRQLSNATESQKVSILDLRQQSFNRNYGEMTQQLQGESLKFLQNRSVQYSEQFFEAKEIMNRSIQYEQEEGFYCDFGMQIDNDILPKELTFHFVQTDKVELINQPKPYMLDEEVQANIIIKKPEAEREVQTTIKEFVDENISTEMVSVVNRGYQFPEEVVRAVSEGEVIDTSFHHLFEKRRNIVDNDYYSIDRFEQKATKYKWVGRASLADNEQQVKRRLFLECLVFSVYNYYGIKTPSRRVSFQSCSNVVGEKMKEGALHVMTSENPELQYLFQFEDWDHSAEKFPLSELITFRSSKQAIRFANYGGLLALAYFLNDFQLFTANHSNLGLVIVNQAVKEIHKLSALGYSLHPQAKNSNEQVIVSPASSIIKLNRLSQAVQLQFFAMLARICDPQASQELMKYLQEIFIHGSTTHQQFRTATLSLKLEKTYETQTAEEFMRMLENRLLRIQETFRGKLYTYKKYHTLTPAIKYALPFELRQERKLVYKEKTVNLGDVVRHVRNKDNLVIVQGEDGSGKSTLLSEMAKQLRESEKLNILEFVELRKEKNRVRDELFQLTKNIVLIDNVELYEGEAMSLIDKYSKGNFEVSFCIATANPKQADMLKNRFPHLTIVETRLLPLDTDSVRNFLMKTVTYQSYTAKKDLIDKIMENPKLVKILSIPFYLSLYASFLSRTDCENHELRERDLTKYMILKEHFSHCSTLHGEEMKEMGIAYKEVLPNLRRIAFEYYHNHLEVNETIRDVLSLYEENDLIRSQLAYYPVILQSVITTSYQPLFVHPLFLQYFLVEAYAFFAEKGYRNMRMDRLYNDPVLLQLIRERYSLEDTYGQLVEVVFASKKFRNTSEASSNALTLLSKIGFIFSNMNFDDCNISEADLSNSVFYQCSFRGADLERVVLYKAQMISCVFDNAVMGKINLFSKKYEIQFTAMATSLSVDGKKIAFGCGNYLIVINAETGAEMKRIEAHLDVIRLVKYTRDGNSLITVADDKTLRIWDIVTYKSVVFKLPQKGSISYSNETETIASVNKNILKVWNLKSMANQAELQGHSQAITTVEFSYDGEWILTGSRDTTLRLWTLRGRQIVVFKGHDSEVTAGKLSPGRRTMVSSSKGKDLIMWETDSGNKILSKKFTNEITEICLDNRQKYIIATFSNDNHLVVLDFLSFDIVHVLTGHQAKIISLSFDHHFRQLLSLGKDRTARLWQFDRIMETERRTVKASSKVHKGPVLAIAYDRVKLRYATAHQNGEINFWGVQSNTLLDQVFSHNGPVKCLQFDRSGKLYSGGSDGSLRIWNLQAKREPRIIQIHSSEMLQLRLSEKSRLIATSSAANELVIYDFTGIKIVMSTREEGRINAIEFSHDQRIMAVGGVEKYVALYEIANSNTVTRKEQLGAHSEAVSSLCFFGESLLVVALKNGQVAIWNHLKAALMKKIENLSPIKNILTFQKKYICFTSEDGKARVVNMDEGREVKVFRYSQPPVAIDLNEDESLLYVGSSQGNVLKWNLNCVQPAGKKVEFDRKAIDVDCSRVVTVESGRSLLVRDLLYHREQVVEVRVDSDIEGVTFDEDRIILLLKNGKYWQVGKKEYRFSRNNHYEGDLFFIRDKPYTNFFKSGLKKIKGMNKPALAVLQEVNS